MGEGAASSRSTSIRNLRSSETLYRYRGNGCSAPPTVVDEKRDGLTGLDNLAVRCKPERNRHQPVIQRDVEQGLAIVLPAHLSAALGRNRHFASNFAVGSRKRLNVYLIPPRLVRLVCDPFSVGRELRQPFVRIRLNDGKWLSISLHWQRPHVKARLGIRGEVQQEAAVSRPARRGFDPRRRQQHLLVSDPAGRLQIQIQVPPRVELNTIRVPSGDQMGKMSSARSAVNRLSTPLSASIK